MMPPKTALESRESLMLDIDACTTNDLVTAFQNILKRRGVSHFIVAESPSNRRDSVSYVSACAITPRGHQDHSLIRAVTRQLSRLAPSRKDPP